MLSRCNTFDLYVFDIALSNEVYQMQKAQKKDPAQLTPEELTKRLQQTKDWHANTKKQHNKGTVRDPQEVKTGTAQESLEVLPRPYSD